MDEEKREIDELIDELVAKGGPTTGQIKANQDPVKVERLKALGWKPTEEKVTVESRLKKIEETLLDHEKRIKICSIQR